MQIAVECYPCILKQVSTLAMAATSDVKEQHRLVKYFLRIISEADHLTSPPELAAHFHHIVGEVSGISDPLLEEKMRATELGLKLLEDFKQKLETHSDPFEAAIRLAIGGNIIDYGVNPDFDLASLEHRIEEVFELGIDRSEVEKLREETGKARKIFYLLDNCGEAVLDRLLIDFFPEKVVIGVRGKPIFNDVTHSEALLSGYGDFPIYDTGDNSPGVVFRRTKAEFLDAMRACDLVIAKGQGNYETLDEYDLPIFHLLRVKCDIISSRLNLPVGSLHIQGRNL